MAHNLSTPAPLYDVDPEHMHNLLGVEWPWLGVLAAVLSVVLTVLLLTAWAAAIRDAVEAAKSDRIHNRRPVQPRSLR